MAKASKWVKKWHVPGSRGNTWTVSVDKDGNYGCSCPLWKFRREECHHIAAVKAGQFDSDAPSCAEQGCRFVLANVREVTNQGDKVLVPLIPFNDSHFLATICTDLLKAGFSWSYIKDRYHLPNRISQKDFMVYIKQFGRKIYGPWNDNLKKHDGFEIIPSEENVCMNTMSTGINTTT